MRRKAKPEVAFIAAFMALMVLPLTVALGLSALGLVAPTDLFWKDAGWKLVTALLVWIGLLVAALLFVVVRVIRRAQRS
jgi:hypothetical protein